MGFSPSIYLRAHVFYRKNPYVDIPTVVEGQKKAVRVSYKLTDKGLEGITQKDLLKRIKEFKKARGL